MTSSVTDESVFWFTFCDEERTPLLARLLFGMFLIVPIIEIAIFVALGGMIGFWWTMGGVVLTALIGSYLLRLQGFAVWRDIQQKLNMGQFPGQSIVDGIMLAIAGALLLTPGYFTDAVGFSLFVPQVRYAIFEFLRKRVTFVSTQSYSSYQNHTSNPHQNADQDGVIDLNDEDWRDDKPSR